MGGTGKCKPGKSTRNGIITLEDLKTYAVRMRVPLVGSYRGHAVVSSPPPSSGAQIPLTLLNILETLGIVLHSILFP